MNLGEFRERTHDEKSTTEIRVQFKNPEDSLPIPIGITTKLKVTDVTVEELEHGHTHLVIHTEEVW